MKKNYNKTTEYNKRENCNKKRKYTGEYKNAREDEREVRREIKEYK